MKKILGLFAASVTLCSAHFVRADTIADWTFETSQPSATNNSIANIAPEIGSGTASGQHASSSTLFSSPTGNGSAHAFDATHWAVNDYFQFEVSTIGFSNITISYDQTSSSSGPGLFDLEYSTDGVNFSVFATDYTVLGYNVSPNQPWSSTTAHSAYSFSYDLASISSIDNVSRLFFRISDDSTTSAGGGTVGTTGSDIVDNFIVSAIPVPEPSTLALGVLGGIACLFTLRRKN